MTYAFDVFDTLLARRVADPRDIFTQAAVKVAASHGVPMAPEAYANERAHAERRLLRAGKHSRLKEIQAEVERSTGLAPDLVEALFAQELELEQRSLWPLPDNAKRVARARAEGHRIIFISDTYFSSAFLHGILVGHGIARVDEPVFVSCEHGVGKASGELFTRIAEQIGISCADIVHHGDNRRADVDGAAKAGAQGRLLTEGFFNRYERTINGFADQNPVSTTAHLELSVLAAALREARLVATPRDRALFDVAVAVAAPLLYWFVQATLRWAGEHRIARLYFLSRDGEVLRQIAADIAATGVATPELHYLNVSRAAAIRAGLAQQADREQLRSLVLALRPCSLREYVGHLGGNASPLLQAYAATDLDRSIADLPLASVVDPLLASADLYAQVYEHNLDHRRRFLAYLKQEGVVSADGQVALVDVGWRLTIHNLVAEAIIEAGGRPPAGYYLGIDEGQTQVGHGLKEAWLWDGRARENWVRIGGVTRIIEVFCTADEPRTMSYDEVDGKLLPAFIADDTGLFADWGLPEVRAGIVAGCAAMRTLGDLPALEPWQKLLVRDLIARFWLDPTQAEVAAWGTFPFEITSVRDGRVTPLYNPSGLLQKATFLLRRNSWRGNDKNSWTAASERTTQPQLRIALEILRKLRVALRPP